MAYWPGKRTAVLIAGPTASGKSAAAMRICEDAGGMVVNADAMQVYEDLRVLTSRPSAADEDRVPHRVFGVLPAARACSAGVWLKLAETCLAEAQQNGLVPVFTGGTGLYFKALEFGLAPVPAIPAGVRERWRNRLREDGACALHVLLAERDKVEADRIPDSDGQRIVRALEVLDATGKSLTHFHQQAAARAPLSGWRIVRACLTPEREQLYARCDTRFEEMMAAGALEEVSSLLKLDLPNDVPAMKAIGVRELAAHMRGELCLDEAVRLGKRNTRRYAKRQMTWIRHQFSDWPAFGDSSRLLEHVGRNLAMNDT